MLSNDSDVRTPLLIRRGALLIIVTLIAWSSLDFARHWKEARLIQREARIIVEGLPSRAAGVRAISRRARERIVPADSPLSFLRPTAWDTWAAQKGHCGEAARVIVTMLHSLGVPASRLYLRGGPEGYFHVAVAYFDAGEWRLADTVNSSPALHRFLEAQPGVIDRLVSNNPFFYSYSFVNWGRFLPFVQVDQRFPPPQALSELLESPLLILAAVKLTVAAALLGWLGYRLWSRPGSVSREAGG